MGRTSNCHCGSIMIPLFQSYVCKAECDLPESMRTTTKVEAKIRSVTIAIPRYRWAPVVGDWVRLASTAAAGPLASSLVGTICKVTAIGSSGYAHLDSVGGQTSYTWLVQHLEKWVPELSETVRHKRTGHIGSVVHLYVNGAVDCMWPVTHVPIHVAPADLEPAP
jgi:hypothetical protein